MPVTKRRIRLLETATERIGRMLSEKYDIRVVWKHDVAMTNGRTVWLPTIGEDAAPEFLDAVPGLIDHEALGHVRHTDFQVMEQGLKKHKERLRLQGLFNAVEDARVEACVVNEYRGCRVNFNKLHDWALPKLFRDWDKISPWGKMVQVVNIMTNFPDGHWARLEVAKLEPELWAFAAPVEPLASRASKTADTAEALKLAEEILEHLKDAAQQLQQEPQPGDGDGDGTEDGDGPKKKKSKKKRKQSGDEDEDTPPSTGGEEEVEEDGDEEGDGEGDEGEDEEEIAPFVPKGLEEEPTEEELEKDEQITSIQNQAREDARASLNGKFKDVYRVYSTERDVVATVPDGYRQTVMRLLEESRRITHVLKSKMMRNLLSQNRAHWEPEQERGKINPRAVFRVALQTSKLVFRKRVPSNSLNTRVSLFIDHSGSMSGPKLMLATETAILFGEVLHQLKVPFEICGFSTSTSCYEGENIYRSCTPTEQKLYTRFGGLWIGVYKSFDEDWPIVRHRCSNMAPNQHDNTYDGETLRIAAQRLLQYPEQRKILFWLNDGEPCPNVQNFIQHHRQYLSEVAQEVEKIVEVFAIGIKTDAVSHFFKNHVMIRDLDDLPRVMIEKLDSLLRIEQQKSQRRVSR